MNGNAQRDSATDTPIVGVMVDLFNCNTGAQEGSTTTNKDGYYALSISEKYLSQDTASKNCYYIQFTATTTSTTTTTTDDDTTTTTDIMDTSVFTTPPNGETLDIYVGRGESILNVDAGINTMQEQQLGSDTFTEWNDSNTYFPTFAPTNSMGMEEEDAMGESAESSSSIGVFPTPSPTFGQMNEMEIEDEEEEGEGIDSELLDDETESATTTTTTTADEQTNHENMILLRSSVRLQLSNIATRMDRDALSLFESVCATFLNSQIIENDSSAVSAVSSSSSQFSLYDLNCNVLRQEIVEQEALRVRVRRRRRGLRLGRRTADETTTTANDDSSSGSNSSSSSRSLNIRVRVMGYTDKTSSVQDATDVKFRDVLVKTFNEYGDQFTDALKEESALLLASTSSSSTSSSSSAESALETAEYFEPLGTVRFVVSSQGNNGNGGGGNASGAQSSSSSDGGDSSSGGNKGIVAAIIVCLVLGTGIWVGLFMVMKRRRKIDQVNQSTESNAGTAGGDMSNTNFNGSGEDDGGDGRNSSLDSVVGSSMAIFKAFPRVPRFNTDSPPCTPPSNITAASSFSPNSMCSYVGSDGEVEIVEDDSSLLLEDHPNAPIRRDVMAPPGKLGLLVTGDASTAEFGLGPSIHTIQPGSPMVGLLHIGDRIVSINDVDTREFSAEEIIQVMAETSGGERKITVLSDQP